MNIRTEIVHSGGSGIVELGLNKKKTFRVNQATCGMFLGYVLIDNKFKDI